jgi:hypothetical protein
MARPLSDLVRPALADALKAQGFAAGDILRFWPEIAGERLAGVTVPIRLIWPPRPKAAPPDAPRQPATLVLKVESAFALEVEMAAAQIIERVNAMHGWRCVGKIRLRQGPVRDEATAGGRAACELDPAAAGALKSSLAGIADEPLRAALERLGRSVLAGKGRK